MSIVIEFFGMQRTVTGADHIEMPVSETVTAQDALEHVRERYPDLPLDSDMMLVTVNNEMSSLDALLKSGDIVSFLPHIGGG